jgi:hypothetical protein
LDGPAVRSEEGASMVDGMDAVFDDTYGTLLDLHQD